MIHRTQCPICSSTECKEVLHVQDYTVSKKEFGIVHCPKCTLRFTQDIPEADEIGAYYKAESYISHTDTRQGLVSRLYHLVRNITLKNKRNLVIGTTKKSQGRLLDVGCGTGAFLNTMKKSGWEVDGLEPDETASKIALKNYGISTQNPQAIYTLTDGQYDAITMWHVLEHVHDLQGYVGRLKKLLKPEGVLFIAVPNYTSADAQKYGQHWAAYDVPRHLYHFSPRSMDVLMTSHQMRISKMKPMWFDSVYVSMLSEQYRHGRSRLISAVVAGWWSNCKAIINIRRCSSLIYVITSDGRK